jgi:hypothetical protein
MQTKDQIAPDHCHWALAPHFKKFDFLTVTARFGWINILLFEMSIKKNLRLFLVEQKFKIE